MKKAFRYSLIALLTVLGVGLIGGLYWIFTVPEVEEPPPPRPMKSKPRITYDYRFLGLVVPESGPLAEYGASMIRGADLAVATLNQALKPGDKPFKLLIEDETAPPPENKRLANDPRTPIIIGHMMERSLYESLELYRRCARPVLLPIISDPELTRLGQGSFFRLMPAYTDEARALAEFARLDLKTASALVVHEDSPYGRTLSQAFSLMMKNKNGAKVEEVIYPEAPEDLLALADQTLADQPDVIFLAVHVRPALYLVKAFSQAGVKTTYLGTHALAMSDSVSILHRLSEKTFVTLPFNAETAPPAGQAFNKKFGEVYRRHPVWLSIMTYDAVMLAARALEEAGSKSGAVKKYLNQLNGPPHTFPGLVGEYYFREKGQGVSPIYIVQVTPALAGRVP